MNKTLRILIALLTIAQVSFGQASNVGEIYGRVTDDKKQPLDFATVVAIEGGITKGGAKTDLQGNYKIKPLNPGKYIIRITYSGYRTEEIQGIVVSAERRVEVNVSLEKNVKNLKEFKVTSYKVPLIKKDGNPAVVSKDQIDHNGTNSIGDVVGLNAGAYQRKAGDGAINLGGDRSSGTLYMLDGIMIRGTRNINLPMGSIESVELLSNGVSAKYGNATGGIVNITTAGIQKTLRGGIRLQQSVEGYGNTLGSINFSGPVYSVNRNGRKEPVVGFMVSLQGRYDKDNNPYYYKYYKLKPELLKQIQENPLVPNPDGTGNFVPAASQVTNNDIIRVKARENGQSSELNWLGKLDIKPTEQTQFTIGTKIDYTSGRAYAFSNSLFAPEANFLSAGYSARGYARFTQRLTKKLSQEKQDAKKSAITNAYYGIQFSYQKDFQEGGHPDHKRNIFDYGYIGKFKSHRSSVYLLDTVKGGYSALKYRGDFSDSVTFTPGGINPLLENYTKAIYADKRFDVFNLTALQGYGGLRNGDGPGSIYSLWGGTSSQIGSFAYSDADQVTVNLDASFDIEQGSKNAKRKDPITHNIQFGLGYDQRTSRSYSLGSISAGGSIWNLMRLITNRHIQNLDLDNPEFIIGGKSYTYDEILAGVATPSQFDTVKYQRKYVSTDQSRFDKELRKKLFPEVANADVNYKELIDIDYYDPKTFSLDMFSADDLLNNGKEVVSYYGYDYLGKKLGKQPSFNDFWTKLDSRGDNLRPIGAFRPIYMFGYLLDRFSYKDLNFNIGVRVDRFDANQKVLKDPYSLYGVRKVSDVGNLPYSTAIDNSDNDKAAPSVSTFDKDYVVYVDNNQSAKPTVVGYRKGDTWFDPFGKEIADPTILSQLYGGGLPIQPWLQNNKDSIKSKTFNPNNSFADYKPQVVLSPRIQFTFPISDNALFYGNYDVIAQTPSSNVFVTPDDYYFLAERGGMGNANMQMERAINYALGYQQKISKKAAMTVEAYYRERKNQIQVQRYLLAYPVTYTSYGNRDFSSTKGMIVKLDFRRSGPIQLNVDYTLQFAEGTGSNTTSQSSLLATGQPNLRTVFPLDFDSRHMLNVQFDYRYSDDFKGPKIGNKYPFNNSGINFRFMTRSGEPYTRTALATPVVGGDFQSTPIIGTINGSRLPWIYELSTRVNKEFALKRKAKKDSEGKVLRNKEPLFLDVYVYITNLLNTKNTLGVYGYTGVGNDDGYINSPQGQQALSNYQFQQSFADLYSNRIVSPNNYNNPRRIYVGFNFDF